MIFHVPPHTFQLSIYIHLSDILFTLKELSTRVVKFRTTCIRAKVFSIQALRTVDLWEGRQRCREAPPSATRCKGS